MFFFHIPALNSPLLSRNKMCAIAYFEAPLEGGPCTTPGPRATVIKFWLYILSPTAKRSSTDYSESKYWFLCRWQLEQEFHFRTRSASPFYRRKCLFANVSGSFIPYCLGPECSGVYNSPRIWTEISLDWGLFDCQDDEWRRILSDGL